MKTTISTLLSGFFFTISSLAVIADDAVPYTTDTGKKVHQQLSGSMRSDEDRARDANRRPVETLEFFGLRDDMTVVELIPGQGWYTKILGPVLKEKGKLYVSVGTSRLEPKIDEYGLTDLLEITGKVEGFVKKEMPGFIFDIASVDLGVTDVDLVLTFRNVHNLSPEARKLINQAVFKALKPGGVYGVIDHTKRHMEPFTAVTWRRVDPVMIIKETVDAGFEFVDYSDIHARAEDSLEYDTRHESLTNESDRFTLKFRKPK